VSFQEAVALGIDNLEHGMLTASDFTSGKQADVCSVNLMTQISASDPKGNAGQGDDSVAGPAPRVDDIDSRRLRAVVANRPTKDERVLQAMDPEVRDSYLKMRQQIDSSASGWVSLPAFKNAMAFERSFVAAAD